jgi:hypothetical protein
MMCSPLSALKKDTYDVHTVDVAEHDRWAVSPLFLLSEPSQQNQKDATLRSAFLIDHALKDG